jgi:hypothetical protein
MQERRVAIDLIRIGRENLQISEHVPQDIGEKNQPGYRHNGLFADGSGVKTNGAMDRLRSGRTAAREGLRRRLKSQIPV